MSRVGSISHLEGPLGAPYGERASNRALNESEAQDIDRNVNDIVARTYLMNLGGESTDAAEKGVFEPSFEIPVSTIIAEPAQIRHNHIGGLVVRNQPHLSSTMDSRETSITKDFHSHVHGQIQDIKIAANNDNDMNPTSFESSNSSAILPEQEVSLHVSKLQEKSKTQKPKNVENLQNPQKTKKALQNAKNNSKNSNNTKAFNQVIDEQEFPPLETSSKSSKPRPRTTDTTKYTSAPIPRPNNGPSASQLQNGVDRNTSAILQAATTRHEQLHQILHSTGQLTQEQDDELDNIYYVHEFADYLTDIFWASLEERLKAWNVPKSFCLTALGTISRIVAERDLVRIRIDGFYKKDGHFDQRHSMPIKEKAKIIETHLMETLPNRWSAISQALNELRISMNFIKSQHRPGSKEEYEATKDTRDEIQLLSKELSFIDTMKNVMDYFTIDIRGNDHLDFCFENFQTYDEAPAHALQQSPLLVAMIKRFEQLFQSPYICSEDSFGFQLSLVHLQRVSKMYIIRVKAPLLSCDHETILDIMFHTKDFTVFDYFGPSFHYQSSRRPQDEIPYEILARSTKKIPILHYTDDLDSPHVLFFLIGCDSDMIPDRRNRFLDKVQLDIIYSYQFCFRCHSTQHITKRCPVPNYAVS